MTPETLQATNRRVRALMERILPGDGTPVPCADMIALQSELANVAEWLRKIPTKPGADSELLKALSDYRASMEQLEQNLPLVLERLLREKARLEGVRSHLAAAAAWTESCKQQL